MRDKFKNFLLDNHSLTIEILKEVGKVSKGLGFSLFFIGDQAKDIIVFKGQ